MQLTTFSRIKKLKSVHVNIEASYIKYVMYSCQTYVTRIVKKIINFSSFWILLFLYTLILTG